MRITQLQDQGYSLSHASMIATVEWALAPDTWKPSRSWCYCCDNCWQGVGAPPVHEDHCPIPALGYAVLHEQHWMQRVCTNCGDFMEVGDTEELCREVYVPLEIKG